MVVQDRRCAIPDMTNLMMQQISEVEEKDERQVLAELAGETIREYIYETWVKDPATKQRVRKVKLSWVGTREVARAKGNIVLEDPIVTDLADAIRIVVKATDLRRNFTVFGGCHQPRQMKVNEVDEKTGEVVGEHYEPDPFCFQKGLSKAQRNALTLCIPNDFLVKYIDRFLRAAGKRPLLGMGDKSDQSRTTTQPARQARPANMKTIEEWNKVTREDIPDFGALERKVWELAKLQPAEMYRELGVKGKSEMTIAPWRAFLTIKQSFFPTPPGEAPMLDEEPLPED